MAETLAQHEVKIELDAEGKSSGVEEEDTKSDTDEIVEPFDPRLIDVTTEVRSLDVLLKRMSVGQIALDPDFQRRHGIWTPKKKSLLIESLLLRIPLPTFYVAELQGGDDLGDNAWAVVDGIQRLSTIAEFVEPTVLGLEPLRLRGLEYLKTEEGKTFQEMPVSLQLRVLESQFTMQVIRKSTPEAVKLNIFARINTGGVPLSAQELRHALMPGQARDILKEMAESDEFRSAVDFSVSDSRMADREMGLRFISFRLSDPEKHREADFDGFLRATMRAMNEWSDKERASRLEDFKHAMLASRAVFANDAFRKRYSASDPRRPVSKALFEAVAVAFANIRESQGPSAIARLQARAIDVRTDFLALMSDPSFDRSISQGTGDPLKVRARFKQTRELLEKVAR